MGRPSGPRLGEDQGGPSDPGLAGAKATLTVQARRGRGNPRSPRPGQGGGRERTRCPGRAQIGVAGSEGVPKAQVGRGRRRLRCRAGRGRARGWGDPRV